MQLQVKMRNRNAFLLLLFPNVSAIRLRPHSRRDVAAQEWRQRQREGDRWRDTVVIGEEVRSRAHGRVARGQWRKVIIYSDALAAALFDNIQI